MMNLTPEERAAGRANFAAVTRRDFLKAGAAAGVVAGGGLGAFYFGYETAIGRPVRVGVIGTGDEGSVLLGNVNPEFIEVRAIADIRPYNVHRAFYGDYALNATLVEARPGLMAKYGWKTRAEADKHVKVYGNYKDLVDHAKDDQIEAVIIALPLHLHAPAAVAAMRADLHVITEKLMGHSVHECKEMAKVASDSHRILATGHQRHYSILYANAMDMIQRGILGDLHYIRAQWHRGNMPLKDIWQPPLPPDAKPDDPLAKELTKRLKDAREQLAKASGAALDRWRLRVAQVEAQIADEILGDHGKTPAGNFGYRGPQIVDAADKVVYQGPAIEELIRWRLWDRTGAGLMAELGSHQLDAASIFISAMHNGVKQHPLNVVAAADRPLFPADRDVEDHVFCVIEFPAPGYDPKDPIASRKKISVQYSSINGNSFGGYGEIVYGTKAALILDEEQEAMLQPNGSPHGTTKVSGSKGGGPAMDTQASGAARGQFDQGFRRRTGRGDAGQRAQPLHRHQPRLRRGIGALGLVHPQSGPGEPAAMPSQGGDGRRRDRPDDQHGGPRRPADRVPGSLVRPRQSGNAREHQARRHALPNLASWEIRLMSLSLNDNEREVGKENFHAAIGSKLVRRELLEESVRKGVASRTAWARCFSATSRSPSRSAWA